jgi:hypothetical protein
MNFPILIPLNIQFVYYILVSQSILLLTNFCINAVNLYFPHSCPGILMSMYGKASGICNKNLQGY